MGFELPADYKDVPTRIQEFKAKHPEGTLRVANSAEPFQVVTVGDQTFVVVVAAAYRTPDDPAPGIGMAWELVPGKTPYTKLSELQNAETSAWGRAIVAVLASESKTVASAEDVRNRAADHAEPERPIAPANPDDPCSLCGSTKAERVNVRGTWRCSAANDCKRRAAEREHPSDSPPAAKPATGANGAQNTPQASTGENSAVSAPSGALPLPDERGSPFTRYQALDFADQARADELWNEAGLSHVESEDPRLHDALDQVEREKAKK